MASARRHERELVHAHTRHAQELAAAVKAAEAAEATAAELAAAAAAAATDAKARAASAPTASDVAAAAAAGPVTCGSWVCSIDPDSGQPYYQSSASGESQWAMPVGFRLTSPSASSVPAAPPPRSDGVSAGRSMTYAQARREHRETERAEEVAAAASEKVRAWMGAASRETRVAEAEEAAAQA